MKCLSLVFAGLLLVAGCTIPDLPIPVLEVSLGTTSSVLFVGQTEQLSATVSPADATIPDLSWSSDDPVVASVDPLGLVTAVSAGTATVTVASADGDKTAVCAVTVYGIDAVVAAADRLLETQNSDGGWPWDDPDTDPATGPSYYNTLGVTARGLVGAYRVTGSDVYLDAAVTAYEVLVTNSTSETASARKLRGPDITFLVELSVATGDSVYAEFAAARYQPTLDEFFGGTATGVAEAIRDARAGSYPALISWDINLYVRGLVAMDGYFPGEGYGADAAAMAEVTYNALYQSPVVFDIANQTQAEYWAGITGAVESFTLTGLHATERDTLKASLLNSQEPDGHFAGVAGAGDVQTSSYSIMALVTAGEKDAALAAMGYLTGAQGANGGWIDSDDVEYTETDSEAAQAMFDVVEGF